MDRCTAENIARRANKDDGVSGRFWQGRYRAQLLLDEASILACAAYVDLNPIRAALADRPENSEFTGAKDRLDDLKERSGTKKERFRKPSHSWERSRRRSRSGWMSPIEIDAQVDPVGCDADSSGRRASLKGFLSVPMAKYLELVDWTGRQLHKGKRGKIPSHLAPMLSRIGLDGSSWCEVVERFGKIFKRAAGGTEAMAEEAARRNQSYLQGPGAAMLQT